MGGDSVPPDQNENMENKDNDEEMEADQEEHGEFEDVSSEGLFSFAFKFD